MKTQPETRARSTKEAGKRALNLWVSKANQACTTQRARYSKNFARCDVGGRARPWRPPRLCEFAGCELAHAASSMLAALLHLLVANVLYW